MGLEHGINKKFLWDLFLFCGVVGRGLLFRARRKMNKIPNFKFALREDLKYEKRFLPCRKDMHAIGWDVFAAPLNRKDLVLKPGEYFKIPLGFRCIPEDGWWYELHPRGSSFIDKKMHNLVGIIDKNYCMEVIFVGQYLPSSTDLSMPDLVIKFGDPIGQIIPVKRIEMSIQEISNQEFEVLSKNLENKEYNLTLNFGDLI